jgi:hypothetical protein
MKCCIEPIIEAMHFERKGIRTMIKSLLQDKFEDHARSLSLCTVKGRMANIVSNWFEIMNAFKNDGSVETRDIIFQLSVRIFDKDVGWERTITNDVMGEHDIAGYLPTRGNDTYYSRKPCIEHLVTYERGNN